MDMTYSIDAAILPMPLPVSQVNPVPDTEEHVDYQRSVHDLYLFPIC